MKPPIRPPIRKPALFWTLVCVSFGLLAAAVIRLTLSAPASGGPLG